MDTERNIKFLHFAQYVAEFRITSKSLFGAIGSDSFWVPLESDSDRFFGSSGSSDCTDGLDGSVAIEIEQDVGINAVDVTDIGFGFLDGVDRVAGDVWHKDSSGHRAGGGWYYGLLYRAGTGVNVAVKRVDQRGNWVSARVTEISGHLFLPPKCKKYAQGSQAAVVDFVIIQYCWRFVKE